MTALLAILTVLAQGSGRGDAPDEGSGILIILGVLALVVVLIGAIWTFAARRASRVPRREPQPPGRAGRSSD